MNSSNNIKIKKGTNLYSERKTIQVLHWIGAGGIVISIVLYGIVLKWSSLEDILNFWNNVALGISASSFISYFSLKYNYQHKVNELVTEFQTSIAKIYKFYETLLIRIQFDSKKEFAPDKKSMDDYEYGVSGLFIDERIKYQIAKEISAEIVKLRESYNSSPITIDAYEKVIKYFSEHLLQAMQEVCDFCCAIVQYDVFYSTSIPTYNCVDDANFVEISSKRNKSFVTMVKTAQWNKYVLEEIERKVKFNELQNVYKECGIKSQVYCALNISPLDMIHYFDDSRSLYRSQDRDIINARCMMLFEPYTATEFYNTVFDKWTKVRFELMNIFGIESFSDEEGLTDEQKEFKQDLVNYNKKMNQLLDQNRYCEAEEIITEFEEKYRPTSSDMDEKEIF